jgi:hypothetical protein
MNDWPCALEYGEDVPVYPRAIRVWLFQAYRRRLEWLACHHREELVSQTKSELTVARWIFFPPGRRHRFQDRIRGEEAAALAAATWILARDTGFLVEERILFARLSRWARRIARVDAEYYDQRSEDQANKRLQPGFGLRRNPRKDKSDEKRK